MHINSGRSWNIYTVDPAVRAVAFWWWLVYVTDVMISTSLWKTSSCMWWCTFVGYNCSFTTAALVVLVILNSCNLGPWLICKRNWSPTYHISWLLFSSNSNSCIKPARHIEIIKLSGQPFTLSKLEIKTPSYVLQQSRKRYLNDLYYLQGLGVWNLNAAAVWCACEVLSGWDRHFSTFLTRGSLEESTSAPARRTWTSHSCYEQRV